MTSEIKLNTDLKIFCPYCKESVIIKQGFKRLQSGVKQRYQCKTCGAFFSRWL